jgi:hypothetical protein
MDHFPAFLLQSVNDVGQAEDVMPPQQAHRLL